jgi:Putative Flp pilus-assembly TadE/G-like
VSGVPKRRALRTSSPTFRPARRDTGQVSILILGLLGVVLILVLGGVDVTAAQIARTRLLDASDSAALDAANALDEAAAYTGGIGTSIVVSNRTVEQAALSNLASRPLPAGIRAWRTAPGTGTTDGHTAIVVLEGVVDLPMTGGVLSALGRSVTITVESRARAPLQ